MRVINFIKKYTRYKCPYCHNYTISYRDKLLIADYRYRHTCRECGGVIQLPAWYTFLLVCELMILFYTNYKLDLAGLQSVLFSTIYLMLIYLVQFPFIPVKKRQTTRE